MSDGVKVFPFHIYHKHAGSRPKKDLTANEKKEVKKMVNDAIGQKKGG